MTLLGQSLVLYLLAGLGVAGAVYLTDASRGADRWLRVLTALPFWPLYLPLLLARPGRTAPSTASAHAAGDEMAGAIAQVDAELVAALNSLEGWASDVLTQEKGRLRELRAAWSAHAERVREMDRILALPEHGAAGRAAPAYCTPHAEAHEQARRQNVERLRRVRQRAYEDLMGMLAWVRELVSMIHLAKFTGAPPSRAAELVAQIAAAVEGLSETIGEEASLPAAATGNR